MCTPHTHHDVPRQFAGTRPRTALQSIPRVTLQTQPRRTHALAKSSHSTRAADLPHDEHTLHDV